MQRWKLMPALALGMLSATAALGQHATCSEPPAPRPRLALALSGGGARGIAHIGVLRALEEAGIPVDAIAANSMGAVVGAIYATGRTADELEQTVRSMDWASLFSGRPDRRVLPVARRRDRYAPVGGVNFDWEKLQLPRGLLAEHRVNRFLIGELAGAGYAAGGDFDRLKIRFRAIAGDLATGEPVVMARGDLPLAVRASMSIPVAFPPVKWEGRQLVDGMIADNLPTDVARGFGACVVVAVDIGSPPLEEEDYQSALGVLSQVSDRLMRRRHRDFAAEADLTIHPDLGDHASTDYSGFEELIARGYEAARGAVEAIRARLAEAGVADLAPRPAPETGAALQGAPIAGVEVVGNRRISERLARRTFNIPVGPPYDMPRGLRAFDKVDASDLFDRTWLDFQPARAAAGVDVRLHVHEAPPNRAEVGFGYTEWERARGSIRLRNQNTLGFGEQVELLLAASDAEQGGQLSLRGERLVVVGLGYRARGYFWSDRPRLFTEDGASINRARFERSGVELALRTSLERWGLVEAGARFGRVETVPRAGVDLEPAHDQVGTLFARAVVDTLDDLAWPEHGRRMVLDGEWNAAGLGAERESWRAAFELRAAQSLARRLVVQLDGFAGFSGDDLPLYDWYRVGGATLLPGFHHDELKGAQALAAALSLRYTAVGQLRLVARAGAGNVFTRAREIELAGLRWGASLGVYHPSPIGPVALELGVRGDGRTLASLSIGWN
jgi:NTE family protein